jgi:hypothetical protein
MAFLVGNLKPLVVYSVVGFGNYPLPWDFKHWTWMQSLVMPGLATLVIALLYYKRWTRRTLSHAEEALVFCSAFGLLLLVKFMYRSFMALGHVNSGPLIVVLAFWFVFSLRKVVELRRLPSGAATTGAFVLSLAIFVTFLHTFRENTPGRDIKFATTWLSYPSIFNRVMGVAPDPAPGESFAQRAVTLVNDIDVALIKRYSQASKPVWIYADEDWAYLLRAERKPATTVLPIPHILMGSDLDNLKAKFARDEPLYLFVEKRHEPLLSSGQAAAVFPGFASRYAPVETGKNLAVYRRKAD